MISKFALGIIALLITLLFIIPSIQYRDITYPLQLIPQSFTCKLKSASSDDWGDDCPSYPYIHITGYNCSGHFNMDYIPDINNLLHKNQTYTFVYNIKYTNGCASLYYPYQDLIRIENSKGEWIWGGLL